MAELAPVAASGTRPAPELAVTLIRGRLGKCRSFTTKEGKRFATVLSQPSPDEFSMPGVVEIESAARLGESGEIITQKCRVTGVPNNYSVTDKNTGEVTQIFSAKNRFIAIED